MKAIYGSIIILGILAIAAANCSRNDAVSPRPQGPRLLRASSTAEQRRAEQVDGERVERRRDARFRRATSRTRCSSPSAR